MGLKDVFQTGAVTIINAFGDVAYSDVAYHSLGTFSYDPVTGTSVEIGGIDTTITKVIFDEISSKEIQGRDILLTDKKMLIANKHLSVTPKVTDYSTIEGIKWNVVDWDTDPAKALFIIYIRET